MDSLLKTASFDFSSRKEKLCGCPHVDKWLVEALKWSGWLRLSSGVVG